MTDLWMMAGEAAEADAADHKLALARVACASYWPVVASVVTEEGLDHAKALISEGVTTSINGIAGSPAETAVLASRVLDSFTEDWKAHIAAKQAVVEDAPAYGEQMGFGFPAEPLPNEAPALEGEIAAWEGTDQQSRVNMGNGLGVSDDSSGPNVAGPGANPGEDPLLHASALDIEAGLEPGDYRLDAFGALIRVEATAWSHLRHINPSEMSDTDIQNHLLMHHHQMSASEDPDENFDKHMEIHGNPGIYGSSHHDHGGGYDEGDDDYRDYRLSSLHTGEEHAPYYIREEGGKFKVVNRNGEVKGTFDSKDAARQQQKALYALVPGATEEAEKRHGQTPKAVQEEGKKASLQLTALQRQAVRVAHSLVDQMPIEAQPHAVAKAMLMRARGFELSEPETDLVVNAAIQRIHQRHTADGVPESKRDRAEKAGDTLPGTDKFPIENASDLAKAKHDIGRTNEPHDKVVNYINRKADELGEPKVGEDDGKEASLQKGAPFAGYKDFHDCVKKNQDKRNPEAYCGTIKNQVEGSRQGRMGRLWNRLMGRTAQGMGMANPMDPSSVANPFSPAQDVNAAMTDTNPTMGGGSAGAGGTMDPSTQPPDEIPGQTVPGSATAASSKPRTKPSSNPNAPNQPSPSMPAGMPISMGQPGLMGGPAMGGQMLTSMPMMAGRAQVLVAESILSDNPEMSDDEALHLASKTIERYPHLVHQAYGGFDFPFGEEDTPGSYTVCPQCNADTFDGRSGHCHNCGYVGGTGSPGFDPLVGPTTIRPGQFDMRNPGTR